MLENTLLVYLLAIYLFSTRGVRENVHSIGIVAYPPPP
tara:strand:+ start:10865 stop:10978 length:114 start_codon:yes stop_codon:yes gene_type:complete